MTQLQAVPQLRLDDELLDDPALLAALDAWQEAKDDLAPYRKRFAELDEQAKAKVADLDLADGTYRVGPFVVTLREAESKQIAFERKPTRITRIRLLADD